MNKDLIVKKYYWIRSKDGVLGGVFKGVGQAFDINPNLLRALYLLSVFGFGVGFVLYPLCWILLPREDLLTDYYRPKILGVCQRISNKTAVELPLIRLIAFITLFASFGTTLLIYILLHFLLDESVSHS